MAKKKCFKKVKFSHTYADELLHVNILKDHFFNERTAF